MLTVLMALIASLPAWAASRVVISTPEPMQVFVDGMLEPTSVGSIRVAVPHIKPGEHVIAIHSLSGQLLHSETVVVPENADVAIKISCYFRSYHDDWRRAPAGGRGDVPFSL